LNISKGISKNGYRCTPLSGDFLLDEPLNYPDIPAHDSVFELLSLSGISFS